MSIIVSAKTNKKATLKLISHISTFLFEEDCGELNRNEKLKRMLREVNKELQESIK